MMFNGEAIIQDGKRTTSDPFLQYNKYYDNLQSTDGL